MFAIRLRVRAEFTARYYDKTFDLRKLEATDFRWSYWDDNESIAHTMLSFRFADGDCLCLSVEIRREKGEAFSPIRGCFKQYELTYEQHGRYRRWGIRARLLAGRDGGHPHQGRLAAGLDVGSESLADSGAPASAQSGLRINNKW